MSSYQRILVPVFSASRAEIQLHRVTELMPSAHAQLLVAYMMDTRSGFEPDGPAPVSVSRRAIEAKRRLDLLLARSNLGWAEVRVILGEPHAALAGLIRSWKPDLLVMCGGHLPEGVAGSCDILTVGHRGILKRIADTLRHAAFRHA